MKYTIVLNGCSETYSSQAEEISAFLREKLMGERKTAEINTIIFYCDEAKKEKLINNSPGDRLKLVKVSRYQPENVLEILMQLAEGQDSDLYLFPGDYAGNELSVRLSCRLGGSSLVGVNSLEARAGMLICFKPVYSNHMLGQFQMNKKPYCIAIAKGVGSDSPETEGIHGIVEELDLTGVSKDGFIKHSEFVKEGAASGMEQSRFIIAAGRGAKNKENIELLKVVADKMGAVLGVSRPAAMNAWAPMQQLIGVSGLMTKPELCIAVGVSGAAAFYAGIEKSGFTVAINTDDKAAIISHSDVAIIDDYKAIMEELVRLMEADK